jgi:hypothetical protein
MGQCVKSLFSPVDSSSSVYARVMTDSSYGRLRGISGFLGIAVPVSLLAALKWLRGPKNVFQSVSIVCQIPEDCDRQLAEIRRAQSELIRQAHHKMLALTLLALAVLLLCFLFTRTGVPKWTKYLLITSVAVSLAACWLQW